MGVIYKHKGSFKNMEKFLNNYNIDDIARILDKYGKIGVSALASATPVDSGLTAGSWSYSVNVSKSSCSISWFNTNLTSAGTPIVILLQYGHGTRQGGYVQGQDYINPAINPVFDNIVDAVWEEVKAV